MQMLNIPTEYKSTYCNDANREYLHGCQKMMMDFTLNVKIHSFKKTRQFKNLRTIIIQSNNMEIEILKTILMGNSK